MFRSIFTKTLRDYRVPLLSWGIGLGLLIYAYFPLYTTQLQGVSPEDLVRLTETQRFFAEPVEVTTAPGYVTWKVIASLPLLLGVWAARAGGRLGRLAEERGALDVVLATPRSRARYLGEGGAALVVALALIAVLIGLGSMAGEAAADVPVAPGGALLTGLNVSLAALLFGLLALFLAQLCTSAGAATGAACGIMVLAWVLDGTGRISPDLAWVSRLSPFYLYNLSKPLIASYGTSPGALLALAALAALFGAASVPLFARRDLGGSAWPWKGAARRESGATALAGAARDVSLRGIGARALRAGTPGLLWWLIGLGILLAWIAGLARTMKDTLLKLLAGSPVFQQLLGSGAFGTDAGFLSGLLFSIMPVLVAFFALTQASAWARDLEAGRLELVLATPVPRWRVYLEAWGAILAALVIAPLLLWLVLLISLRVAGLHVGTGHLLGAFVGFLPIELVTAALVFLAAGRLPVGAITGGDGGLLAASFLGEFLNPVLHLPGWLIGLSLFHHYGSPLLEGPRWGPWLALTALAAVILALGLVLFTRGDVPRGA
jgi:ABC-2 type transport system permease protein